MLRDASGGRRTSLLVDGAFVAIVLVYLASASRFFEHVEDAVISYTYARNAAEGYGFVPNIGGERVEGFSDPLWVFLLTGGQLLGVTPFVTSRVLGIFFAIGELALVYRIALDALSPGAAAPEPGARDPRPAALLAPAMLACMPGFAMWNHMGLENPLYGLLLSLATWLQLRELGDPRRRPWSALAALGLLLTRPEAPLYVAILLVHRVARRGALRREALRRTGAWVALVAVPFAAFIVWRFAYFGWPLPMPYYVKLAEKRTPTLAALLHGDDPGLAYLSEGLVTLRLAPLLGLAVLAPLLRRDR